MRDHTYTFIHSSGHKISAFGTSAASAFITAMNGFYNPEGWQLRKIDDKDCEPRRMEISVREVAI